ncbi:MAG: acetylornithine transaminase [Candidatus Nanopelagicaceae bacterium]|nr:acetylornithine transaminase [Candidatus Nanopelagicaceae bacterium]
MTISTKDFSTRWENALQANYGQPELTLVSGKGAKVTDSEGRSYLDFLGGIATNILGHAHPAIVKAVTVQISTLGHVSNFYSHPGVLTLAEKLKELVGDPSARVFFCNSGAEANEAALKLSRKTGRKRIVATQGAFHGRTMGALSLTGQPSKRDPFKPLLPGIVHVPYGDLEAMRKRVSRRTAMVIIEPILGEAGVVMPPAGYLAGVRALCNATGALMVVDAVQTGMGRTGQWFGYEHEGIVPDVVTLAKGLGGGLPLGAMIALGGTAYLFQPGDHGTTFGGNPVACASALAAIDVLEKRSLLKQARDHEFTLKSLLSHLPGVKEVRGMGLLLGIVLEREIATDMKHALQKAGVLVNAPTPNVLRIAPALIVTTSEVSKFISIFSKVLGEVNHG